MRVFATTFADMPDFVQLCRRLFAADRFVLKAVIGGLLSFIPVVNFLAFGWLLRFAAGVQRTGSTVLPEWSDWRGLFLDGLRAFLVGFVYAGLPALVLSVVPVIGSLLAFLVAVFSPLWIATAFVLMERAGGQFPAAFDLTVVWEAFRRLWMQMVLPGLGFAALLLVASPLYGFVVFLGGMLLLAWATLLLREEGRIV